MPRSCTTQGRGPSLSLWIGLALLAVFALVGAGDPAVATADPQSAVAVGPLDVATGSFFGSGLPPQVLVWLGLLGPLIFPSRIAPGTHVRRDPSSRQPPRPCPR